MSIKNLVKNKELKRKQIVSKILNITEMIRGSYSVVKTKCGKPTCWCVDGDGHQHARLTWTEKGIGNTKAVPQEDHQWLTKMTKAYRVFRQLRQELLEVETELKNDLSLLEQEIIDNTRKNRPYLEGKIEKSELKQKKVPKKNKNQK